MPLLYLTEKPITNQRTLPTQLAASPHGPSALLPLKHDNAHVLLKAQTVVVFCSTVSRGCE